MIIEVNKKYVTQAGVVVDIIYEIPDKTLTYRFIGCNREVGFTCLYSLRGTALFCQSSYSLVKEYTEPRVIKAYVVAYQKGTIDIVFENQYKNLREKPIASVKVTLTEGILADEPTE